MSENSVDSFIGAQPEVAKDFSTFYNDYMHDLYGDAWNGHEQSPDHWTQKINNFFTGDADRAKHMYDAYLTNLKNRNEFLSQQSARAYDKMMDDTKYQRMMKDFEAAGLNPYLLINSGGVSASSAPSGAKANYDVHSRAQKNSNGNSGRNFALILLAVARIAAALL